LIRYLREALKGNQYINPAIHCVVLHL